MFDTYVRFYAGLRPNALAMMTPSQRVTYAELEADVNRMAAGFCGLGLTRAVGVVSISVAPAYLKYVILLALARLGIVTSPPTDPAPDVILDLSEAVSNDGEIHLGSEWVAATLAKPVVPVDTVRVPQNATVRVMLSSGTTRIPRRVARSWQAVEANTRTAASTYLGGKAGRWVCLTGFDSGLGQAMTLAAWSVGAAIVTGYDPQRLAQDLEMVSPTIIGLTPALLRQLLSSLPPSTPVNTGLRLVVTGAALSQGDAVEARLRLSSELMISYGTTEVGSLALADGAWLAQVPGIIGLPVPGVQIDVVDDTGTPVPAGHQGYIRIRSDRASDSYLDDPAATMATFRDGAIYPGDMGRILPNGWITYDGRIEERIEVDGLKFLPGYLEAVVIGCPGLVDVAAFLAPDEAGQDACWLAVVTGEGFRRDHLTDLIAGQGAALPPIRYAWTDTIPRNETGKVLRQQLRKDAMAVLGTG